jgi:hypothetical protein
MIRNTTGRLLTISLAILAAAALVTGLASTASAEKKVKSVQTEAKWVKFDAAAKKVSAKVRKAGRGNKDKQVKPGKTVEWNVKPEGSVLTRTTVAFNGRKAELTDIPQGKTVNIYWVPDPSGEGRFARKIDVVMSTEEMMEKWKED